jgi:tetratricopeptide (TPR) repeat protein
VLACIALATATRPSTAQIRTGDTAWESGDFPAARAAYLRALAEDPSAVRALYRLGLLASWEDRLDSALVLLRRARAVDPEDPDVRYAEALVLSWQGDFDGSIARYDSLLARHPDRADARVGRANVLAWLGDWDGATAGYEAVLAQDPANADALAGLGRLRLWQGRPSLALESADRALAAKPGHRDAALLRRDARNALRPYLEPTLGWSDDSDENTALWQTLRVSVSLADGVRGFGTIGMLEAWDETLDARRSLAEAGVTLTRGAVAVTAAAGARTLDPDGGEGRTAWTGRAVAVWRAASRFTVGAGVAHYPFDETAFLIGQDIDITDVEASADVRLAQGLVLGAGMSQGWLSDDNRRRAFVGAITKDLPKGFWIGAYGRWLGYDEVAVGYFSPDRYTIAEGRAGWNRTPSPWGWRLLAGLGAQWIGEGPRPRANGGWMRG